MARTITITVSPTGAVVVKTAGYTGTSCKDATRQLERAMGSVTDDTPCKDTTEHTTTTNQIRN